MIGRNFLHWQWPLASTGLHNLKKKALYALYVCDTRRFVADITVNQVDMDTEGYSLYHNLASFPKFMHGTGAMHASEVTREREVLKIIVLAPVPYFI